MSSVQPTSDADSQHTTLGNAVQELPAKATAPLLHHQQDDFFQVLVRELVLQFSYSTGNATEEEVLLQTLIGTHIHQLVADVGRQFLDELFSLHILLLENTDQILQLRFDLVQHRLTRQFSVIPVIISMLSMTYGQYSQMNFLSVLSFDSSFHLSVDSAIERIILPMSKVGPR